MAYTVQRLTELSSLSRVKQRQSLPSIEPPSRATATNLPLPIGHTVPRTVVCRHGDEHHHHHHQLGWQRPVTGWSPGFLWSIENSLINAEDSADRPEILGFFACHSGYYVLNWFWLRLD
eukprot:COSAG02_NODE_790_length_17186_cov_791.824603_13_plen_119_part_00